MSTPPMKSWCCATSQKGALFRRIIHFVRNMFRSGWRLPSSTSFAFKDEAYGFHDATRVMAATIPCARDLWSSAVKGTSMLPAAKAEGLCRNIQTSANTLASLQAEVVKAHRETMPVVMMSASQLQAPHVDPAAVAYHAASAKLPHFPVPASTARAGGQNIAAADVIIESKAAMSNPVLTNVRATSVHDIDGAPRALAMARLQSELRWTLEVAAAAVTASSKAETDRTLNALKAEVASVLSDVDCTKLKWGHKAQHPELVPLLLQHRPSLNVAVNRISELIVAVDTEHVGSIAAPALIALAMALLLLHVLHRIVSLVSGRLRMLIFGYSIRADKFACGRPVPRTVSRQRFRMREDAGAVLLQPRVRWSPLPEPLRSVETGARAERLHSSSPYSVVRHSKSQLARKGTPKAPDGEAATRPLVTLMCRALSFEAAAWPMPLKAPPPSALAALIRLQVSVQVMA